MGMAGMTRTVGETLTSLMEDGSAYLPGLVPGEDGALLEAGYGVVKDGMLAAGSPESRPGAWSWRPGRSGRTSWSWKPGEEAPQSG